MLTFNNFRQFASSSSFLFGSVILDSFCRNLKSFIYVTQNKLVNFKYLAVDRSFFVFWKIFYDKFHFFLLFKLSFVGFSTAWNIFGMLWQIMFIQKISLTYSKPITLNSSIVSTCFAIYPKCYRKKEAWKHQQTGVYLKAKPTNAENLCLFLENVDKNSRIILSFHQSGNNKGGKEALCLP